MKIFRLKKEGEIVFAQKNSSNEYIRLQGSYESGFTVQGERIENAELLAPIEPGSIYAIGLNYKKHAEEVGMEAPRYPILFIKGRNSLNHPEKAIELPRGLSSDLVDYECELAVVIGKKCKNVKREDALDYVLGYTCANDVSARDWQGKKGGGQWCKAKSFDTFSPLGPCLLTQDEMKNPSGLQIQTRVNGETLQDWTTADMIFDVPSIIEFLSGSMTLLPGDVILTGTPQGVGMGRVPPVWLKAGDVVEIEIEKIGILRNPVIEEAL